jgi:hypothetical protein
MYYLRFFTLKTTFVIKKNYFDFGEPIKFNARYRSFKGYYAKAQFDLELSWSSIHDSNIVQMVLTWAFLSVPIICISSDG